MDAFWKALMPALIEYGVPLVLAALSAVASMALNAMRKHFDSAAAQSLLDRLERSAQLAVMDVEQTLMPKIKAAAADGRITPEEKDELKAAALARARAILGDRGVRDVQANGQNIDSVINHLIEAKVNEMRYGRP